MTRTTESLAVTWTFQQLGHAVALREVALIEAVQACGHGAAPPDSPAVRLPAHPLEQRLCSAPHRSGGGAV
jgi:hypothetical protein